MKKITFGKDLKIAAGLGVLGLIAGLIVGIWMQPTLPENIPFSKEAMLAIAGIQVMLMTFILSFFGSKLASKVGLKLKAAFTAKDTMWMIIISCVTAFIVFSMDKFVFAQYLGEYANEKFQFSLLELLASVLYGGIIEEVMLRLFLVSLLVFVLHKLFARNKTASEIPVWIFMTAVFIAAMAFAAGHLPATQMVFGLSAPIVIRCMVLNGLGGLVFGYFYWKKGLAMGMASHITMHLFRLLVVMPLLY